MSVLVPNGTTGIHANSPQGDMALTASNNVVSADVSGMKSISYTLPNGVTKTESTVPPHIPGVSG